VTLIIVLIIMVSTLNVTDNCPIVRNLSEYNEYKYNIISRSGNYINDPCCENITLRIFNDATCCYYKTEPDLLCPYGLRKYCFVNSNYVQPPKRVTKIEHTFFAGICVSILLGFLIFICVVVRNPPKTLGL
jgi:hypothetical protein